MPRNRPAVSGYARIAQAEEEEEEDEGADGHLEQQYSDYEDASQHSKPLSIPDARYAPIQPGRREAMHIPSGISSPRRPGRRRRTNSGVDIKAINARLERWADEIKERFNIRRFKGRNVEVEQLEIYSSVFQAPEWARPATKNDMETDYDDSALRMSKLEFDDIVESVRTAIELGTHPKLISQGSSGSYFAQSSSGKVVGVFKPKDEEPYANKNPKWTKWIHRNLFPFAFGRACLIPNLSYVSEAAAYVLDVQLRTNIVPYTGVVNLSSRSFFYDYFDRRAYYRKMKPLPEKPGSFQVFLKGFRGATEFFREHPWPDHNNHGFKDAPKKKKRRWAEDCRPGSTPAEAEDDGDGEEGEASLEADRKATGFWSEGLQQSFREQLEKLVILDYIMRNTDRGTDNWMIRIDREKQEASIVAELPKGGDNPFADGNGAQPNEYRRRDETMSRTPASNSEGATPHLGAIDNSLSWPWKHPDAWRSYPFGWLFLPVSLIGRPFSDKTRKHFLPLLTSKEWWIDTQVKLRKCFEMDADFKERMFARQIAVMKGQAWNVVEALKTRDHGPLELTRRPRVCVWDDIVEIPVAVPLARPSGEMRRKAEQIRPAVAAAAAVPRDHIAEEDEMDISAAHGSAPQLRHDLLGLASPTRQPAENPFNHSRQGSADAVPRLSESSDVISSPDPKTGGLSSPRHHPRNRPGALRSSTIAHSTIHDSTRRPWEKPWDSPRAARRRFSFGPRRSGTYDEDGDEDGDIGYAAASDQDGSRRRVIVERLEMVKSKPPFFTWC